MYDLHVRCNGLVKTHKKTDVTRAPTELVVHGALLWDAFPQFSCSLCEGLISMQWSNSILLIWQKDDVPENMVYEKKSKKGGNEGA